MRRGSCQGRVGEDPVRDGSEVIRRQVARGKENWHTLRSEIEMILTFWSLSKKCAQKYVPV